MAKLNIHFAILDNPSKLPSGPMISPSPGPTFDIDVAAPEIEVTKSSPVNDNSIATIKKIKKYKKIKDITDYIKLFPIFSLL